MDKVLAALCIFGILTSAHAKPVRPNLMKHPAIVRLYDIAEQRFFCSGAVVSENIIVTAAHCLGGHVDGIEVKNMYGKPTGAWVMNYVGEGRSDQALLVGNFSMFNTLPIEQRPEKIVEALNRNSMYACGFPYAGPLFCTGLIFKQIDVFQFDAVGTAWPGMSGGPVIDRETGAVIGVITAMSGPDIVLSPTINIFYNLGLSEVK